MASVFRHSQLSIETPEGALFSLPLAAPSTRFFALMIDMAGFLVVNTLLQAVLGLLQLLEVAALISDGWRFALMGVAAFASYLLYWMLFEHFWNGQTPGKRVMQIRVTDIHGMPLSFPQIAARNLLRPVDSLPFFYLLGGLFVLMTQHMQRLGDIAANTVVISSRAPRQPELDALWPLPHNSLRAYPWVEARLRRQTDPEEAALLVQALERRDTLEPQARIQVFRELAAEFKAKTPIPDDAIAGVTDEQFVRSVVDSLYRDTRAV